MDRPDPTAEAARAFVRALPPESRADGASVELEVDGVAYLLSVRPNRRAERRASPEDDDLPAGVRCAVQSVRRVYRLIRDMRAAAGGRDRRVAARDIVAADKKARGLDAMSVHTVGHALTVLKKQELVVKMRLLGYRLAAQPAAPAEPAAGALGDAPGAVAATEPVSAF